MKKCILLHGLGQNSSSWNGITLGLNIESEALDLLSLIDENKISYNNMYKVFFDYCEQIEGKVDLCGLSLGAILALNYAIEKPQKVNSLVLIAGQYKMPKLLLKIQNMIFYLLPQSSFDGMGMQKDDVLTLTKSMIKIDMSSGLKNIECPTFILCGEKDKANKKAAKEMKKLIKNSRLHIVQGAGHEINLDSPDKLVKIMNEFYDII